VGKPEASATLAARDRLSQYEKERWREEVFCAALGRSKANVLRDGEFRAAFGPGTGEQFPGAAKTPGDCSLPAARFRILSPCFCAGQSPDLKFRFARKSLGIWDVGAHRLPIFVRQPCERRRIGFDPSFLARLLLQDLDSAHLLVCGGRGPRSC